MDIGLKIKEKRVAMGMSQIELADGICTQGTISNIENGYTIPSTVILKDISKKLELDVFDFAFKDDSVVKTLLEKVNKLIANGESEKAYYQLVVNLEGHEISDANFKKKYYYYLGSTCLIGLGDVEQAKKIFNNILVDFEMSNTVDDILVYVGLGIAACMNEELDDGKKWFEKAVQLLKNETLFIAENIKEIMKIYFNVAKYYSQIKDYERAVKECNTGLFWAKELNSNYHIEYLNYEKGFNLYHMGKVKEGVSCYNVAYLFAVILNNDVIIKTIHKDCKKYNISLKSANDILANY